MDQDTLTIDIFTFPKTGAVPIITEAKADRTCWEESDDNSYKGHCKAIRPDTKE